MKIKLFVILFPLLISGLHGQTQENDSDTNSQAIICLGKMIDSIPKILAFDNNKPINADTFQNITHIIAFYKTPYGHISIDSICYDIMYWVSGDIICITRCGFELRTDTMFKLLSLTIKKYKDVYLIIKVTKVVLSNGQILINPKVRNEQTNVLSTEPYEKSIYSDKYCEYYSTATFVNGCENYRKSIIDMINKEEKRLNTKLYKINGANVESLFPGVKFHLK